ncbi:sulfate transporter CysZ [Methylogaea oryzae]|uniref:Sulfate transporter CysZ n=1 Tax=Methylogaea oryzae TaxID=1295382 RepID=A0A8D5AHX1_9GAMM|nr:sulfate transporter CysZ [Methylogaea oryzae]BBL70721.1 sulfate transporter CysZ [Methylogaea oryzae]
MTPTLDPTKLNNPVHAARCLWQGLALLARPELRHFVWMPLLLNLCLYALGLWAIRHYFDAAMAYLLPAWLDWVRWLLWPLVAGSFIALMFFSFTLLANLLGAPFYGILAEKTAVLLGLPAAAEAQQSWTRAAWLSLAAESARLRYYLVRAVPALLLFVIPGVNVLAPLVWLVFNGWFLMLEYTSYPLERYGCGFPEQRRLLGKARIGATGYGVLVALGLAVPLLNVLMPPAAVAGAVAYIAGARREA